MNYILDTWEDAPPTDDLRWLAYALATTYHETGNNRHVHQYVDEWIDVAEAAPRRHHRLQLRSPASCRPGYSSRQSRQEQNSLFLASVDDVRECMRLTHEASSPRCGRRRLRTWCRWSSAWSFRNCSHGRSPRSSVTGLPSRLQDFLHPSISRAVIASFSSRIDMKPIISRWHSALAAIHASAAFARA